MSVLLRIFRFIFAPILLAFFAIVAAQHFADIWQPWLPTINQLPYYLFPIAAILALQFNCSRLSFLALFLLAYCAYEQDVFGAGVHDDIRRSQLFLAGTLLIGFLAMSKDRALFSFHTLKSLLGFIACITLGFAWQYFAAQIATPFSSSVPPAINLLTPLYVPMGVSSLVVCIYAVWRASFVDSTLVVTLFSWLFIYYDPNGLPLAVLLSTLALLFICVILTESYKLAYRDDLTGLSSRRALNTMSLSLNGHYSVAMVDIDHFKVFNDTYGHDIGDQVLRLIGSKLDKVKGGGKVYRYGGEEFTIVFPNKDVEAILPHLEELRCKIRDYKIVIRNEQRKNSDKSARHNETATANNTVSVTISMGVAEHHGQRTFAQTIKQADKALYIAKKNGRDRVFV